MALYIARYGQHHAHVGPDKTTFSAPRRLILLALCSATAACGVRSELPLGAPAYALIPAEVAAPAPDRYLLGPMDVVSILVFREPELSVESSQIDPAGNIVLPLIGAVRAEGRSPAELSQFVESALTRYVHNPQVSISITQIGQTIAVEGGVNQPGVYPIPGRSSLIEALALARSTSQIAANDQVIVFREIDGRRAGARFDIRRIRAGLDPDPVILPGDRIVVGFSALKEAWREYFTAPIFNIFRAI